MKEPWNIPQIWKWVEIKALGDIVSGGTPSTKEMSYWGDDVNWISPADLTGYTKKTIARGAKNLTHKGLAKSSARLMPAGSIHFSSRAPIGYVAINSEPLSTNQGFKSLVPAQGVFNEYVYYYLKAAKYIAEERASGTTFREISGTAFGKLPLPFPPLPEQHRIVSKTEELFSELDNGIENLKKAQEQIKTYRQAVLKYAFEGKLTGGKESWKELLLEEVFDTIDGDRGKNYPKKADYLTKGYCLFLSTKNVRPNGFLFDERIFISKEKHQILRAGKLERGDIVITTRGTLGNAAVFDDSVPFEVVRINSGMLILRLNILNIYRSFILYLIQSPIFSFQIRKRKSGTAQPQLPAGVLRKFKLPIPPIEIQHRIVSEIESRLSVCDKIEQTIEDSLKKAEALRQSILKKAFSGELTKDWREKYPELITGENSAEKLLEKIEAEKALAVGRKKPRSKKTKGIK
jgi:type I restriction enzyme S subunit